MALTYRDFLDDSGGQQMQQPAGPTVGVDPYIQQLMAANPNNEYIQELGLKSYLQSIESAQAQQQQQQQMQMLSQMMGGGQAPSAGMGMGMGMGMQAAPVQQRQLDPQTGQYVDIAQPAQEYTQQIPTMPQQGDLSNLAIEVPEQQPGTLGSLASAMGKYGGPMPYVNNLSQGLQAATAAGRRGPQGAFEYMQEAKPFGIYPMWIQGGKALTGKDFSRVDPSTLSSKPFYQSVLDSDAMNNPYVNAAGKGLLGSLSSLGSRIGL